MNNSETQKALAIWGEKAPLVQRLFPKAEPLDLQILFEASQRLHLNPLLGEISIIPARGGSRLYLGKAGLAKILNENYGGFGVEYKRGFDQAAAEFFPKGNHHLSGRGFYVECSITRRDYPPVVARAYWDEYYRPNSDAWKNFPISMLEKVAFIKAARHCLGIAIPGAEEVGETTTITSVDGPPDAEAKRAQWLGFLEEHHLTEEEAYAALGGRTVSQWVADKPGRTVEDALQEILAVSGRG